MTEQLNAILLLPTECHQDPIQIAQVSDTLSLAARHLLCDTQSPTDTLLCTSCPDATAWSCMHSKPFLSIARFTSRPCPSFLSTSPSRFLRWFPKKLRPTALSPCYRSTSLSPHPLPVHTLQRAVNAKPAHFTLLYTPRRAN